MNSLRVRALRGVRLFVPLLVASVTYAAPPLAAAQSKAWSGECVGIGNAAGVATIQGLECLLANVLSVFIAMIGLAAFIMIVIGSFRYLVSGGNTKGTETARNTISYAVFGIVVALSAFIIVNLLAAFTGIDALTVLRVPGMNENVVTEQCPNTGDRRCTGEGWQYCPAAGANWVSTGQACP